MNTLIKSFFVGSILIATTSVSAQKVELFNGKNLNNWNFFLCYSATTFKVLLQCKNMKGTL